MTSMFALLPWLLALALGASEPATSPVSPTAPAAELQPVPEPEVPTWRFRRGDKPVKVVVLAGSIGAWPRQPYADRIEAMCRHVEVVNLSKTGLGAWPLKKRFKDQVLRNRYLDLDAAGQEFWLLYGGGINSIGDPESTNHHMKNTFVLAHRAGMKVVAFTVTPWGDDDDRRFRGIGALQYRRATRKVVDFVMGRLDPEEALGDHARKRPGQAEAPWTPGECPDVAVDLYDSPLRDRDAPPRDLVAGRAALEKDARWQRAHRDLEPAARAAALERDAWLLASTPQWYLREELRSFDHIHPDAEGHRLIANHACPSLPASWGCECPPAGSAGGSEAMGE